MKPQIEAQAVSELIQLIRDAGPEAMEDIAMAAKARLDRDRVFAEVIRKVIGPKLGKHFQALAQGVRMPIYG